MKCTYRDKCCHHTFNTLVIPQRCRISITPSVLSTFCTCSSVEASFSYLRGIVSKICRSTLWLPRAPKSALKMPVLISRVVPRSMQQPQRLYPVYFAHALTSVLIYILSIFIASCTDITTTKMSLSCAIVLVRATTGLVGASFWSSQFLQVLCVCNPSVHLQSLFYTVATAYQSSFSVL